MMNTAKNLDFKEEKAAVKSAKKPERAEYIMSVEEYRRLPEERRKKAEADMKYFWENSDTLVPKALQAAVIEQLESGFPVSYGDGDGHVLTRYPDGRIYLSEVDMETYEMTETFLRMATPEDDMGIYG